MPSVKIRRILLPLDLEETVLPAVVIRQAAALARHFNAEILVLHVIKPLTYMGRSGIARELVERDVATADDQLKGILGSRLKGLAVRHLVVKGDPAREIVRTAADKRIDLIVMPTHGLGAYGRLLVGSVTAKVLHNSECPVWAGKHLEGTSDQSFSIRNILCAVDFSSHSPITVKWAQDAANEFGARLTLAHVTPGVEIYGPSGHQVLTDMKRELVDGASKMMAKIQEDLGTKAEAYIGSGDVPKIISQAADETKADLLVVGCRSLDRRFGNTAYGIIRESHVPVLSV